MRRIINWVMRRRLRCLDASYPSPLAFRIERINCTVMEVEL